MWKIQYSDKCEGEKTELGSHLHGHIVHIYIRDNVSLIAWRSVDEISWAKKISLIKYLK